MSHLVYSDENSHLELNPGPPFKTFSNGHIQSNDKMGACVLLHDLFEEQLRKVE